MLPVLLDLKIVKIYTFGVFLVLAFFWGSFVLWRNIRLTAQKEEEIFDGLFLSLAGGLFFSRLVYVGLNFNKFGFDILKFILINGYPGLSLLGGLGGGTFTLFLYLFINKISFRETIDYFVTPVFIALVFGKLGAFFSGAEVGVKTDFFLAVKYIGYDNLRHLTPFYEAIIFAAGAYISHKLLFAVRKEKLPPASVFYFFCWYFGLTYFIFDNLKANHLYLQEFNFNKIVSLILVLTFSFYYLYYFRKLVFTYGKPTYKKIAKKIGGRLGKRGKKVAKTN